MKLITIPVLLLGYSQHHMEYSGTISASSKTHLEMMFDVLTSMAEQRIHAVSARQHTLGE